LKPGAKTRAKSESVSRVRAKKGIRPIKKKLPYILMSFDIWEPSNTV